MKLSVRDAARLLQVSEQFIRMGLRNGQLPWGSAVKMSGRWTYCIYPDKFEEITGRKVSR